MLNHIALSLAVVAGLGSAAHGALFVATDGSASADITAAANGPNTDLTIVLTNLISANDTLSAMDLLTGLDFGSKDMDDFTVISQSATQEFIFSDDNNGAVSNGSFSPGWSTSSGKLYFDGFGGGGLPIIGGPANGGTSYPNANSSLTSGGHGTDIYLTATFVLQIDGTFDVDSIDTVRFFFNTNGNVVVDGNPGGGAGTPEPASLGILGLGAVGLLARKRRA